MHILFYLGPPLVFLSLFNGSAECMHREIVPPVHFLHTIQTRLDCIDGEGKGNGRDKERRTGKQGGILSLQVFGCLW